MKESDPGREETDRAFERLYRRHRSDVYRAAMRRTHDHFEAEDVTQSAFLDAYRAVLRGTEPELPRAWLLAIAENVRRRRFAASLRRPRPVAVDDEVAAPAPQRYETDEIVSALASLPPNQCAAFVLREVGGLSYPEIASRLEVSVPSVQMLLFRARQGIRSHLAPPDRLFSGFAVPAWLTGLVHRFETFSVGARAAGAVGATVVVAAGVSGASAEAEPPARSSAPVVSAAAAPVEPAAVDTAQPVVAPASPARTVRRVVRDSGTPAPARAPRPSSTPEPAVAPARPVPPDVVTAAPAAPSTVGSVTASGDGEPAAVALVPAPPDLGPIALPVPEPQPVPVPVIELPSAEGPDLPALDLPVVPEVPVDVGGTPPLPPLPGS